MKRLRLEIESLGLSFKREMAVLASILLAFFLASVGFLVFVGVSFLCVLPIFFAIVFGYLYLSRYGAMKRKRSAAKEEEFVTLFTYFSIYIENGSNVYHALESILPYANHLEEPLRRFILEIDEDKSVSPYLRFSAEFEDLSFREVLLSIYEMVEEEAGPYLEQFSRRFNRLADEKHKAMRERSMGRLSSLSSLPLVGSGITMMLLMVGVLEVLGGMIDGL